MCAEKNKSIDNNNDRSSIITTSPFQWGIRSFVSSCSVWEYEIIILLFELNVLIILDLPNLTTMTFNGKRALGGNGEEECRVKINGKDSFTNTLIMRSKLIVDGIWWFLSPHSIQLNVDLPSLTSINCSRKCELVHNNIGKVILESKCKLSTD